MRVYVCAESANGATAFLCLSHRGALATIAPMRDERTIVVLGGDETGQVWVLQPGRGPVPFRFPNVPGARDAAGGPVGLPPS